MQTMQCMAAEIAHQLGFREMGVYHYNANAEKAGERAVRFDGMIAGMSAGDIVVCQFHTWNGLKFERGLVDHIKAYHGRVIIFIHSLEALMIKSSRFMLGETIELYNQAEALIVPSHEMKKLLLDSGIRGDMKFIVQEMWDYTTEMELRTMPIFRKEIHCPGVAPQLVQNWKYEIPLKQDAGLKPDELLMELSRGGFGLEWHHDEQAYQYMRYGSSYTLSRYLAAGIPVIVPAGISCQKLIEENHLGLVADTLDEAVKDVEAMEESQYQEYVRHVGRFAPALRNGYYTKKCLIDAVLALFREDMGRGLSQAADAYELGEYEFLTVSLKKSYGGNRALSWNMSGKPDGFLIYDTSGKLVEETDNSYQHYSLIKEEGMEGFVIKAYVNTLKGKMIVAKSAPVYLHVESKDAAPLVSVVIPAYNAENYVVRCIDTVLAQSFADMEVVIVDDGSVDHTPDILVWYAENYQNIRVIRQENAGVQAARNAGIMHAKGEYTGFVDSDDMIRPDMVERLYECIKSNGCDIAITSGYEINHRGYSPIMQHSIKEDTAFTAEDFLRMYASGGYAMPAVWNKLYRTSLVKEHLFPLIRYEDEAWTPYVLSYAEMICYLNICAYEYDRINCGSSLVDTWARKSKEEVFQDHKCSILFYLEQGNPKRLELLKKLAKSELSSFMKALAYVGYEELRKQVEGMG
jgi:glycosyltransferase involved in cell wall biosynthesis